MQLPAELQTIVGALVLWLVVNGLKSASEWFGRDLNGWATVIVTVVTATVIFFLNQILAQVPASAQPLVSTILQLLVLLFAGVGIKRLEVKALGHFSK